MTPPLRPLVVSTSQYNSPEVVWASVKDPPVAGALCRVSLGTPAWMGSESRATDHVFPNYWHQWDAMHLPRCAYHFLKNGAGGAKQARWFMSLVAKAGGWHPGDRLCLDVEDYQGDTSITEIIDFFYNALLLAPAWMTIDDCLLYSREDIMNPLSFAKLTPAQREWIKEIWQWPAGYPDNYETWTFDQLTQAYQYDRSKYGPVALVQYAASLIVPGISLPGYLSTECNLPNPVWMDAWQTETAAWYGEVPAPVDSVAALELVGLDGTIRKFVQEV